MHEGITTGLKGGRLHLDAEDIDTMQDSIHNRSLMPNSSIRLVIKFATAPINLAVSRGSSSARDLPDPDTRGPACVSGDQ